MVVDIDLGDLYNKVFGGSPGEGFKPNLPAVSGYTKGKRVEQGTSAGSDYYRTDGVLGREYFMPVIITYPTGALQNNNGVVQPNGQTATISLPFPIVSIKGRRKIIDTPLTERTGTVQEYINSEGYEIRIRGFIIAATNDYPEATVVQMRKLIESTFPVSIACPKTDIFLIRPGSSGSDQVVLYDYDFPDLKGVKNVQPYELMFRTCEPFNLIDIS